MWGRSFIIRGSGFPSRQAGDFEQPVLGSACRIFLFCQKLKEQIAMKKVLVTFVLALTGVCLAEGNLLSQATGAGVGSAQPSSTPANQNQKVIKDPAEFNAYMQALNMTDPKQMAAAMEA